MRRAVQDLRPGQLSPHPGLWYQRMAPEPQKPDEPLSADDKEQHLASVSRIPIPPFYRSAFGRWREAVSSGAFTWEVELTSRLLIGHGEPSPLGIGLALHPTYGVPYIPGSALKGLLAHHLHETRGSAAAEWRAPLHEDKQRRRAHQGDGVPVEPPGAWYATVFGAPAIPGVPDGDARGYVRFEDALLIPQPDQPPPLARDVLTPHQVEYYKHHGAQPPVDWDNPNPVGFLTVAPGARFLIAVSYDPGAEAWAELAICDLGRALEQRGIGGKTSVGYGRMRPLSPAPTGAGGGRPGLAADGDPSAPAEPENPAALEALASAVTAFETSDASKLDAFDAIDFAPLLASVAPADRGLARDALKPVFGHKKLRNKRRSELASLRQLLAETDES